MGGFTSQNQAPSPVEPLASRLQGHASRLKSALAIVYDIYPPAGKEQAISPEPSGANGWMMQSNALLEELIICLEHVRSEVGTL